VSDWRTLRDLDGQGGRPKGTSFRAFKRLAPGWREARDFRVLDPARDRAEIEALRVAGRVYASSRAIILLAPGAAQQILDAIREN